MKNFKFVENLNRAAKRFQLKGKKHSPEIFMAVGVVGVVASAILACKETRKLDDIIDPHKEKVEELHKAINDTPEAADESKKELTMTYIHTGWALTKNYAPSVVLGTLSLGALVGSNHIYRKRNACLTAAYASLDTAFKSYRGNVVDRFGEEVDKQLRFGTKTVEVEDADGNKKTCDVADKEERPVVTGYAFFFDAASPYYEEDAEYNKMFLRSQQSLANDKLHVDGYIYLNDVLKMIGLEPTKAGQMIGWVWDKNDPNDNTVVDFGLYSAHNKNFVNGDEPVALLDMNCTGNIYELMV